MTPQTTGARTDDLTTWRNGDLETNQVFASIGQTDAARPEAPAQTSQPGDTHLLAA